MQMQRQKTAMTLAWLLAGCLAPGAAESPAIGLATAKGNFRVDSSEVRSNATLLDGMTVETARVGSDLRLNAGARLNLAAESIGTVHRDRLILKRGAGELKNSTSYWIDAQGLRVYAAAASASARVAFGEDDRVLVAALNGPVRVTTAQGLLVANMAAGGTLAFDTQQAGAAAPTKVTGKLEKKGDRYFVTDETTNVTREVVGTGLDQHVGQRVEITGVIDPTAKPTAPASSVVKITEVKPLAAAAAGAQAGGWAGLPAAAKVAIISGIGVGAGVGIAAAGGAFGPGRRVITP
jgi:hypothetical protein